MTCTVLSKNNLNGLPAHLKQFPQWIVWRLEPKPNEPKPSKIPYNPHIPSQRASSTDQKTWGTFSEAEIIYNSGMGFSGLGFVFSKDDPFIAIDFDHCIDDGKLNKCAFVNTSLLDSYTEVSQSGTGLHVIGLAKNPGGGDGGHKKGDIEFYTHGRFFALTGNVWENHKEVLPISQTVLQIFYQKYFLTKEVPAAPPKKVHMQQPNKAVDLSDDKIIELLSNAKNSSKFTSLWRGSTSGYNSGSEADLALTSMLSFYTQDVNQLQRLLLKSGLNREKMNRADYMARTINKATSGLTEKFGDRQPVCFFCKAPIVYREDMKCPTCGRKRKF